MLTPKVAKEISLILTAIHRSKQGLTVDECSTITGIPKSITRSRITRLSVNDMVVSCGKRKALSGNMTNAWKLKPQDT